MFVELKFDQMYTRLFTSQGRKNQKTNHEVEISHCTSLTRTSRAHSNFTKGLFEQFVPLNEQNNKFFFKICKF
jgi:hypothetical protein